MPQKVLVFAAVALIAVCAVAFWPVPSPPVQPHYVGIVDWSESMPADVEFFVSAVHDGIVRPLTFGSKVDILVAGANRQTESFHREIPSLGASLEDDQMAKRSLRSAAAETEAFVRRALSGPRAPDTGLLEALARIPAGGELRVLVVSDGKESTPKTVDLDRVKILPGAPDALVQKSVRAVPVPGHFLDGARIQFRVPTLPPDFVDKAVNDTASVEAFWRAYLARVAPRATVISFDSRVLGWDGLPSGAAK